MEMKKLTVEDLSPALFWDVDKSDLDFEKHKAYVVGRALEYGTYDDWVKVRNYYGNDSIKQILLNLRFIDELSLSYVSAYYKVDKTQFRCYKHAQLVGNCWPY